MDVSNGQPQNDSVDDDDHEDLPENQTDQKVMSTSGISMPPAPQAYSRPNFQFGMYPNPSIANLNVPPIIAQTLEMAAAAPAPPLPLLSTTNPLSFNIMPMSMSNENNLINTHKKPTTNDSVDEEGEQHTDKLSAQPTESPNSISTTQNSVHITTDSIDETSTNGVVPLPKPIETVHKYKPTFLFGNPLYQSANYNQYNTFLPYFLYPLHQNKIQSQSRKNLTKSKRIRSPQKSSSPPIKTIVINIS